LKDKDLYTKNVNEPHNLDDVRKVEGWIWRQGYYGNMTPCVMDSARVQCHQAHADMERWQEERETLAQEFRHAIQILNKMENVWTSLAKDHKNKPGNSAYASKVANMYQRIKLEPFLDGLVNGVAWDIARHLFD
ncbi:hypothetical protein C8R45DRAFT_832826, partial [Mycena sanguinolenta]